MRNSEIQRLGGFGTPPGRHYDRSARSSLHWPGEGGSPFGPGDSRKRGPRLRGGVRSPNQEPRWSAERRARPAGCASAPAALSDGNTWQCGADHSWCACRRSASLLCLGRPNKQNSGAFAPRERIASPSPGGRGSRPQSAGWGVRRHRESQRASRALAPPAGLRPTTSPSRGGCIRARRWARNKGVAPIMPTWRNKPPNRQYLNNRYTPRQQQDLRNAALAATQRLYCDALELWRTCARKKCRHRQAGPLSAKRMDERVATAAAPCACGGAGRRSAPHRTRKSQGMGHAPQSAVSQARP